MRDNMVPPNDRRQRKTHVNPLLTGIQAFVEQQWSVLCESEELNYANDAVPNQFQQLQQSNGRSYKSTLPVSCLPKRYTLYGPMLLLGPSFSSYTPEWGAFYRSLTSGQSQELYLSIADAFCKSGHHVTHIALNAPIQLDLETGSGQESNLMRSPVHLQPLFGDFGPASYDFTSRLTSADFSGAFWVETSQISGVKQVWAPRWTMFSRGNIREKRRILGQSGTFPGLTASQLGQPLADIDVVDFYVGIGYFAFSYLKRGVRRVFGWDLNPWSIEGLKRGCERNGWSCLVVAIDGDIDKRSIVVKQIVENLISQQPPRCVAFCGDNRFAAETMASISSGLWETDHRLNVRHANLGLLPTSQGVWTAAAQVLNTKTGGWLHVHENADISQVDEKEKDILMALNQIARGETENSWQVLREHVEMVKTYAPGVGHYVFDIKVWPAK